MSLAIKGVKMKKLTTLFILGVFITAFGVTTAFAEETTTAPQRPKVQKEGLKQGLKNGPKTDKLQNRTKKEPKEGLKYGLKDGLKYGLKDGAKNGQINGAKKSN